MTTLDAASLPAGTRLLHVGPHKTGTTAVQHALWNARGVMLSQGVRFAGRSRNPAAAAMAVVGRPSQYSADESPPIRLWQALVREITGAAQPRVIASSEYFAWASDDAIRRIAGDLDPARLHVVVTMRALDRVIPSTWQQNVQQGSTGTIDEWLRAILADPESGFWLLERQDRLLERWAAVLGPDRVTGIVVDEGDHGFVMRAFESLLGLETGTLVAERDRMNRSLTLPEAEAVRAFNIAFKAANHPRPLHARVMRYGAAQLMKERVPPPDEAPVRLPGWALDQVVAVQDELVRRVREGGFRIIGDLDRLAVAAPARSDAEAADPASVAITPEVVGALTVAMLHSTGAVRQAAVSRGPFKFAEPPEMLRLPTYQILGGLAGRAWRGTVGRLPLPARKPKG